jgi:hypothetical protein
MKPASVERHMAHQMHIQREALARKGVEPDRIEQEIQQLTNAIFSRSAYREQA